MFAISSNEERYEGSYETIEEAIEEAANGYAYETFWVGKCVPPTQPEQWWDAADWLEHVSCQDSLQRRICRRLGRFHDRATRGIGEGSPCGNGILVRPHKLRPRFFLVEDAVKYVVVDGKPVKASDVLV